MKLKQAKQPQNSFVFLGRGHIPNIFQKRLPAVMGVEVLPGSLTCLLPTPLSAGNNRIVLADFSGLY